MIFLTEHRVLTIFVLPLALASLSSPAAAQESRPFLGSGGGLRVSLLPIAWSYDSRFGLRREANSVLREEEGLGFDLDSDALGTSTIPGLKPLEETLRVALDDPSFRINLGRSRSQVTVSGVRIPLHAAIQVGDWLSAGLMVPLVRRRTEIDLSWVSDSATANVGISPSFTNPDAATSFLSALSASTAEIDARRREICEMEGTGSEACEAIRDLHSDLRRFADALALAYGSRTFFPLVGSSSGNALLAYFSQLSTDVGRYGVVALPASLPLAETPLDRAGLHALITDPAFGIAAEGLLDWRSEWSLGDIELHADIRLLSSPVENGSGERNGFSYLLAAGGLLRLGTGSPDDPSRLFDEGSGDGQTDLEVRFFGDLARGGRMGVEAQFIYGTQLEGGRTRRIGSPEELLAPMSNQHELSWKPGNYWRASLIPRLHLTPGFALSLRYQYERLEESSYRWQAAPVDPALEPAVLNLETAHTLHEIGVGMVYSTAQSSARGRSFAPYDILALYRSTIGGSGGSAPKQGRVQVGIRLYWTLWGSNRGE